MKALTTEETTPKDNSNTPLIIRVDIICFNCSLVDRCLALGKNLSIKIMFRQFTIDPQIIHSLRYTCLGDFIKI
jgi:hypothetical protein